MKVDCAVIRDVLPLYCDDACSAQTREMIREHLRECPACRELLKKMQEEEPIPTDTAVGAQAALLRIGRSLRRRRLLAFAMGGLALALAAALAAGGMALYRRATTTFPTQGLCSYLMEQPVYQDMEATQEAAAQHYPGLDAHDLREACIYTAADGTTREFAVLTFADGDAAQQAASVLLQYGYARLDEHAGNAAEEMRLRGLHIRITRNHLIFTISDEWGSGAAAVEAYLKARHYDLRE
ncbi:MAG: zf-HC2 domain-containing protein [Eubacteriales bacterium]|nr:zf-HC2 domain-containing protein [Eubacteriales bacterium]